MSFDMDFTFMSRYTDGFELNFRGRSYRFHDPDANRKEFVVTGLNRLPPLPSKKMYRIIVKNLTFQAQKANGNFYDVDECDLYLEFQNAYLGLDFLTYLEDRLYRQI
ncbi:unnamed protein product, partial [Mesorhabditis belari]|uniref:Uncharacterized protein n=1 Tax=Mesorhabditis belari TaxID=2138241 RepID=A0AAF3EAG8_9BILA